MIASITIVAPFREQLRPIAGGIAFLGRYASKLLFLLVGDGEGGYFVEVVYYVALGGFFVEDG